MIQARNLTKRFENFTALENISCSIPKGCIYGMVGSNGAGKSTFLRLIAGVYRSDAGMVFLDGKNVWENPAIKEKIAYIPDELYFLPGANILRMAKLWASIYPQFDAARLNELCRTLELDMKKPISTFSKGMKRQAATILALSAKPEYILFDETFDGLDPVMRAYVKNLICDDVLAREATAIITSHSLRELEDTCDQLALLHRGGLVLESDVQNLKTAQFKIQIAFREEYDKSRFQDIDLLHYAQHGSVATFIVRGEREAIVERLTALSPILLDVLPLSLEEVFTYEMETLGYSFGLEQGGILQ